MDNKNLISVIIPTYNREKTILYSIESVLNQDYESIEVIVVDDGSTDNTEKIVLEINDSRVKYYKLKKNMGACFARNYGIKKANGKYIAFQDSDDEWLSNKLCTQILNMKKNNSMIDFCSYERAMDGKIKKMPSFFKCLKFKVFGVKNELLFGNFISTQLILLKKECLENINFDQNLPRFQDWDLMLRISKKYKISYTKKVLVKTYVQNDSITKSNDKLINAINIMLKKEYDNKLKIDSTLYSILARYCTTEKKKYYKLSLKKYFRLKNFVKYLLNY